MTDISGNMGDNQASYQAERWASIIDRLLKLFPQSSSRKQYLDALAHLIHSLSGCRCVGVRILDNEGNIPYGSYVGFSQEFWESENWLCIRNDSCLCTRVASARPEPWELPYLSLSGSFFCADMFAFVDQLTEEERPGFRGVCTSAGFASLAVIPFKWQDKTLGVIHMADERPGMVSEEIVESIELVCPVIGEAAYRFDVEEELRCSHDTESSVNALLHLSLVDITLDELLRRSLNLILSVPQLGFDTRASIFLVDQPGTLTMKVQRGLSDEILQGCEQVAFGRCMCGMAALTGRLQYGTHPAQPWQAQFTAHAHYCVPITGGDGVLGVINVYLDEQHDRRWEQRKEERFLTAIADTLAGVILRKRTEAALLQAKDYAETLIETANTMIVSLDIDGNIQMLNRAAEQITGYTKEELRGKNWFEVLVPRERYPLVRDMFSIARRQGHVPRNFENPIVTKSGEERHITWRNSELRQGGKLAGTISFGIDVTERKRADEELRRSMERLQKTLEGTIQAMAMTVEMRDPYTAGHQQRVAELACEIGRQMGLAEEQIRVIHLAAQVHDIGKINVPAEILSKPGRLNELEFSLIRAHSEIGYDVLKRIDFPWPIATIVLQHHERIDGSGYPHGLTGENTLLEARIIAVADVVEAMASHRPYRPALGIGLALEEIVRHRGVLYDRAVVDACLKAFAEEKVVFE